MVEDALIRLTVLREVVERAKVVGSRAETAGRAVTVTDGRKVLHD